MGSDGFVKVSSVEAAGESRAIDITDNQGRRWVIPAGALDQFASITRRSALEIECEPGFEIHWKRADELADALAIGAVLVTRDEAARKSLVDDEVSMKAAKVYGSADSDVVRVGDLFACKIPSVIVQRLREEDAKIAKEAVAATGPDQRRRAALDQDGVAMKEEKDFVQVDEPLPLGDPSRATRLGMED